MEITLKADGLKESQSRFRRIIYLAPRRVREINGQYAVLLRQALVAHASGRPGPDIETGQFAHGFQTKTSNGGYTIEAWNDQPQAERLEFGFVGVDSAGRHYNQPPYPYARPAFEEIAPLYIQAMTDLYPEISK